MRQTGQPGPLSPNLPVATPRWGPLEEGASPVPAPLHLVPVTCQPTAPHLDYQVRRGPEAWGVPAFSRGAVGSGMWAKEEEGLQRAGSALE